MVLALRPRVIRPDEILGGLTPGEAGRFMAVLRRLREERQIALLWIESSTRSSRFQTVIMAFLAGATTVVGPIVGAVFIGVASEILLRKFRYVYMLGLGVTLIMVALVLRDRRASLGHRASASRPHPLPGSGARPRD